MLLPCLVLLTFSAYFLILSSTTCPEGGTCFSDPGPPTLIINQENAPQGSSQANLVEAFSPLAKNLLCVSI